MCAKNYQPLDEDIKSQVQETNVLYLIQKVGISSEYLNLVKDLTHFSDEVIASWLNINVKTFRSYKKSSIPIKPNLQEHLILLVSLLKHGIEVFSSTKSFDQWLDTMNFQMGNRKPTDYLNTISGIQFIDQHLTGIEYGDNA